MTDTAEPEAQARARVLVCPHVVGEQPEAFQVVRLPRPYGVAAWLVGHGVVLELQRAAATATPSSLFVGDAVIADGAMLLATPVDPLFVFLPLVQRHMSKYFTTIPQMLADASSASSLRCAASHSDEPDEELGTAEAAAASAGAIDYQVLASVAVDLSRICDAKDGGDATPVYRYNEAKALAWLNHKLQLVTRGLAAFDAAAVTAKARATTFNIGAQALAEPERLRLAVAFLSEYLEPEWRSKLCRANDIEDLESSSAAPGSKADAFSRALQAAMNPRAAFKRNRSNDTLVSPPAKRSKGQSALDKVDKRGMRSLASLFGNTKPK